MRGAWAEQSCIDNKGERRKEEERNKRERRDPGREWEKEKRRKKIWWGRQAAIHAAAIIRSSGYTEQRVESQHTVSVQCVWRYEREHAHTYTRTHIYTHLCILSTILSLFIWGTRSIPSDNHSRHTGLSHVSMTHTHTPQWQCSYLLQNCLKCQPNTS